MTNNMSRRIRQHNGEIKGGARYTTNNKGTGQWNLYGRIHHLTKQQAAHLEKRIQIRSRRKDIRKQCLTPIECRLEAIRQILEEYNRVGKTMEDVELIFQTEDPNPITQTN
jgi:predicted GIY-YIG superfamily endonuclease